MMARSGEMHVYLREKGLWKLVSVSHDSSPRAGPFYYHKQHWGPTDKKGEELLGRQLFVIIPCYVRFSVLWDQNFYHSVHVPTAYFSFLPSSELISPFMDR